MTQEEKDKSILELEKMLVLGFSEYHLDDKQITITAKYRSSDDILKAIRYFKSSPEKSPLINHLEAELLLNIKGIQNKEYKFPTREEAEADLKRVYDAIEKLKAEPE